MYPKEAAGGRFAGASEFYNGKEQKHESREQRV
jgi:hypothetical protein